jgi:hypothetical protein
MQKHLEQILRRRRAGLNSPALRGIILTILFALIFPLLAFRVGPRTMALGSRVVRPANPNNRAITGDRRQPAELSDDFYNTFNAEVEPFLHDISRMNAGNVQDLQFLIAKLDRLHTVITEEEKTYRDRLVAYFDEPPRTPAQVQDEAEDEEIKGIRDNLLFLALWFVIVGAANTAATFLSIVAVNRYVRFIDRQLPPPIFSSVANMSRVVAWEAKRALQIDGDMGHVQWMEVRRNEVGGINLIGLHRSVPEVDSENKPVSQWVRAQRYFISTDMWGRIRDTIIRDMRVPRTVVPPGQQQMGQEAGRGNPPFIPLQRPPTPPGNDLAEDFFSRPTTPPKTPDRTVMVEAVAPKAKNGSSDDTAVQPPIRLLTPPPTKSETTDEKRDRLCEELARILEGVFTEHELQQLYATLNLDYTRFAGTRLEKCQDLINFYRRRQRLTELVRACVDMHPFVLWGDIFDLYDE